MRFDVTWSDVVNDRAPAFAGSSGMADIRADVLGLASDALAVATLGSEICHVGDVMCCDVL